jgi:hypothetical protein
MSRPLSRRLPDFSREFQTSTEFHGYLIYFDLGLGMLPLISTKLMIKRYLSNL